MDKIPHKFWARWYKLYLKYDRPGMEEHLGETLLGRMHPYANRLMNDYLMDLMNYLETGKKVKK